MPEKTSECAGAYRPRNDDVSRKLSSIPSLHLSGTPLEDLPLRFRDFFGFFVQICPGVDAKDEPNVRSIPAIQVCRLRETRVASHYDPFESRFAAGRGRTVDVGRRTLVTRTVSQALRNKQRLRCVGQ